MQVGITAKQVKINGKTATFQNKTAEIPFYHTEFDGEIFTPALSEQTGPTYLGRTFQTRLGDVFLVAYPKSGTHWLTHITAQIANPPGTMTEELQASISNIPFLERTLPKQLEVLPSPRYMYAHLPYHLIPYSDEHIVKYIVIARNPRDVVVSQFNFMRNLKLIDFHGEWDEFLTLFMQGNGFGGSFFDQVLGWWTHRDGNNVLFLQYEELQKDLPKQVGIIANFLGYQLSQESIEEIAEKCTFKNMKQDKVGAIETNKDVVMRKGQSFYRKGIVGDWRNYFSDIQLAQFNDWCNSRLGGTGLKFDFG